MELKNSIRDHYHLLIYILEDYILSYAGRVKTNYEFNKEIICIHRLESSN